jgi:hypothetical protein
MEQVEKVQAKQHVDAFPVDVKILTRPPGHELPPGDNDPGSLLTRRGDV